jgi:hypothetical protein
MTNNLLLALELTGVILVAQATAGRLHARLAGEEATTLKLEFAVIAAVVLYLGAMAAISILAELPEPAAARFDPGVLRALPLPPA